MTQLRILLFLSLYVLVLSCSTIRLQGRKGLDRPMDGNNFLYLSGDFKNMNTDTIRACKTLFGNFSNGNNCYENQRRVNITVIDKNNLELKKIDHNIVVGSVIIKGKFRHGYFKMKRQWVANFHVGPLLWVLGDNIKYIGITKENNLVILDSGSGGILFLVVLPIFAADNGPFIYEYERSH